MTRPFVVGIPTLNRYDLLVKCIDALFAGSAKPEMVYVVDNGGHFYTDGYSSQEDHVGRLLSQYHPMQVIQPQRNMGVAASWNILLRLTKTTPMILVNDDVFVGKNTLEVLMRHPGPCIATALGWSCFRHDHSAWEIIGDYDETFYPAYYEDNDMDWRRGLAGVHRDVCEGDTDAIFHRPSSTMAAMTADEQADLRRHHAYSTAYYRLKWGGLPKSAGNPDSGERFTKPFNGASPEAVAELVAGLHAPEKYGFPRILVGGQQR